MFSPGPPEPDQAAAVFLLQFCRRPTMADDLKNRGAADRSRVNVHEDYEVRYWTEKWGVSKEQLVDAVKKAGVSVEAVARELGKS
jgi:hypothetical protein